MVWYETVVGDAALSDFLPRKYTKGDSVLSSSQARL